MLLFNSFLSKLTRTKDYISICRNSENMFCTAETFKENISFFIAIVTIKIIVFF